MKRPRRRPASCCRFDLRKIYGVIKISKMLCWDKIQRGIVKKYSENVL